MEENYMMYYNQYTRITLKENLGKLTSYILLFYKFCLHKISMNNFVGEKPNTKLCNKYVELASGLQVNFAKITLIRVNYDLYFLNVVCVFLHFKQDPLPFKYHGLPLGVNPRLSSMWEPLIILTRWLLSQRNMYVRVSDTYKFCAQCHSYLLLVILKEAY